MLGLRRRAVATLAASAAVAGTVPAIAAGAIEGHEYWAEKGPVRLYLWRKRLAGNERRPVLFLVHGSSNSGRSTFDLQVPGADDYSAMNLFAALGYDVWTMDHEGYGRSTHTAGNADVATGADDLEAAAVVVARETGAASWHMLGTSSGALRAGVFAMRRPERVDRLVLAAFVWTGEGAPTLIQRAKNIEAYRANARRKRDREMIRSIFTRDRPGTAAPAVADALADAELVFGDTIPTGTYLDMVSKLPLVDPERLRAPVLMLRGEHDGIATMDDLLGFFGKLPNAEKQFVVLAGAAHSLGLSHDRHRAWHAAHAFLSLPASSVG